MAVRAKGSLEHSGNIAVRKAAVWMLLGAVIFSAAAFAQRGFGGRGFGGRGFGGGGIFATPPTPPVDFPKQGEFHFIRMEYTDLPQHRHGYGYVSRDAAADGWWAMDWPDADQHFSFGIERLTRVDVGEPRHMSLTDGHLFDQPWIYATQTGWWDLTDAEIARLREYLLRGGFLVTDDFWGTDWDWFRATMARVFPDQAIADIGLADQVMHVVYDIGQKDLTFIPGTRHLRRGPGGTMIMQQPYGTTPAWRAIDDPRGRMVVAINYNTDVGDAWEYADSPYYPEPMTALAYRYGVNYLVYAMTH